MFLKFDLIFIIIEIKLNNQLQLKTILKKIIRGS